VFPVPAANVQEPPPPEPPLSAEKLVQAAPFPPPVDVIVENIEGFPELPADASDAGAAPPAPTVIGVEEPISNEIFVPPGNEVRYPPAPPPPPPAPTVKPPDPPPATTK
jgi:hypothetical protein